MKIELKLTEDSYNSYPSETDDKDLVKCKMEMSTFDHSNFLRYVKFYNELSNDIMEKLKESKWISVGDRLPQYDQKCLVLCYDEFELSVYTKNGFEFMNDYKGCIIQNVDHWQPILAPSG